MSRARMCTVASAAVVVASLALAPDGRAAKSCNTMNNYLYDSWFNPADHYVHNGGLVLDPRYEYLGYDWVAIASWHQGGLPPV
jgi:hypothetical protein